MKKLWLVALSLGLIIAFSASAFAVDVKFSGEFYVAGMYLDKTSLKKDSGTDGQSTAFYFQRLRVRTEFVVAPGLSLITRFDAMERAWGAARSTPSTVLDNRSFGTTAENENIAFDRAYVQYVSPIGIFGAGYMPEGTWGTILGNGEKSVAKISYTLPVGGLSLIAQLVKAVEGSTTAKNLTGSDDADFNLLYLMAIYNWKAGQAGLLWIGARDASTRPAAAYQGQYYYLEPYAIVQLGPVKVQAELQYVFGKFRKYDNGVGDVDVSNWGGWIDATATFGPVYFGGSFVYLAGDDPSTTDKMEGGVLNGGNDWNPCLLLWNFDRTYWVGSLAGQGTSVNANPMNNAWFYQGRIGVKPVENLDIMASVSYAYADQKPTGYASDKYGWEIDVTGTYKITNNLSYMLGIGYLPTGDYFKGATNLSVRDDYIVINKLTLTF